MSKWLKTSAGKRQDCLCLRVVSVVVSVVVVVVVCVCGVVWHVQHTFRLYIQKRPRVYRHHAHMLKHMCAWCPYTRKRFERTHGDVLDGHTGLFSVSQTPHNKPTQRDTETDRERARKKSEKEEREETTRGGRKDRTLTFHGVCFSKPLTFHSGFMFFLLLVAVSSTFRDFKPYLIYKRGVA